MKIGFFTDSYLPQLDGVATSVAASAKELKKLGHEVYIIAPKYPGYKDKRNVMRIFSVQILEKPDIRLALQIPQRSLVRILRIDFDIIHGHSGGPITFLGWQIAQLKNIPYVGTYHTFWNRYGHYFLRGVIRPKMLEASSALFGNVCDSLIAPTGKVKDELIKYGITKPINIIPSGLQVERFGNEKSNYLRTKLDLKKEDKIILSVGRLGSEKSVDFLLKAFKHIREKSKENYVLVLVGEGKQKEELMLLARELKIADKVIFTGAIPNKDIPKVYADAEVFIFASQTETQGMVVIEAMASRLPVVAVKDKAYKGVVINGETGFLVRKNPKEFAEKVLQILQDETLRKEMAKKAYVIAQDYSATRTAKELENLYFHLLSEHVAEKTTWKDVVKSLNSDMIRIIRPDSRFTRTYLNLKELNRIKDYIRDYLTG